MPARYELPARIWVASDVLGTARDTRIGGLNVRLHTPTNASEGNRGVPDLPGVPEADLAELTDPNMTWTCRYAAFTRDPAAIALQAVAMEIDAAPIPLDETPLWTNWTPRERAVQVVAMNIGDWFDAIRGWLELATMQDLDHREPVYDTNTIGSGFEAWDGTSFEAAGFTSAMPQINEVSLELWRCALIAAGEGRRPAASQLLARDARAAFLRANYRKAVLDAATSAEMILAGLYGQTWPTVANKPPLTKLSLRSYIDWLISKGSLNGARRADLDRLSAARNEAIHEGRHVSEDTARTAVNTAYQLVRDHVPLQV